MENKKTPEQWFQKLKEPYRSDILGYIIQEKQHDLFNSLIKALNRAVLCQYDKLDMLCESIEAGETTYLEPETLKPEQMESGKWFVVTNRFDKDYLVKVIKVDNEYFYIEKGVILEDGTPEPEKKLELSRLKNYRYAVSDLVLKYFPDEVFEDVSLINEVNNSQVTEQQNQNWSEKVELRPEDLVSGEVYTLVSPSGHRYTFSYDVLKIVESRVYYNSMYSHKAKKRFNKDRDHYYMDVDFGEDKFYHATPEEKKLLGEEQTEIENIKKLLEESNRLYALKEIELTKLQEKFDESEKMVKYWEKRAESVTKGLEGLQKDYNELNAKYEELQAKFNQLEPKGEKVYIHYNTKQEKWLQAESLELALQESPENKQIYEAVCIGKKKSVLVSE